VTILIVLISYITKEFILFGFISLLIAAMSGLITEILKNNRIIIMTAHCIGLLFSAYILFVFIKFDLVPTMIFFG
jgi:hypothetical protein